ncbi:hypothetical protein FMM68_11005 [Lachnospiraceae bacterium MD329]|nr:hypothetical protein [Lachnospiraceae bacterium MD329]
MLTTEDIKELLKSRAPVICHSRISAFYSDIEYAYINAVIIRYNPETRKTERTLELMDKNLNAVAIVSPDNVRRKDTEQVEG